MVARRASDSASLRENRLKVERMLQAEIIDRAIAPGGSEFTLAKHDHEWIVRVDGRTLMSSRVHDSEESLAEEALARHERPRSVLVGGLGLGFTLRAVLDEVAADARVVVAELVAELVAWNRTHLAHLHDHALDDPRVEVVVGDVVEVIKARAGAFDVILLDVDNGPVALSSETNQRLYSESGTRACHRALLPGGVLSVWSSGPSPRYERRLELAGFEVDVLRVAAREGSRARHVIFMAERRAASRAR